MDTDSSLVSLESARRAPIELPPTLTTKALEALIRPELRSADVSVSCVVGEVPDSVTFQAAGPAVFSITLVVQGTGRTMLDGVAPLDIVSSNAVVFWSNGPVSGQDYIEGGKPIEIVDIRLHPDYLSHTVGSMADAIRNSLAVDRSDPDRKAFLLAVPLSAELFDVARSILACDIREPKLRHIFMRAKALEALALTLALLQRNASAAAARLSPKEREKLDEARRLIETSFAEPWTIEAVAAAVGLSETKLKLGFREVIGKSVRAYLREVRMDHAERLLSEGRSVTEAALACGYGNLSYFSKAFFHSKGVVPRDLGARK
ncbi:AraC family transcriptional regulator [Hyphomicrobium sp.]|uniref:helix-turn-helix transcriptional regulator n=1 Tax=Hyphomicrobium sp. TaxID=82 RepID=UPI0025C5BA25|nr:AraC family transcriptional regulator [Hyphomicrobium sp.]MCC7250309.1 helix-turn-helix transcriptional regulator [Hyphomicrobium sp.]